MQTIEIKCDSCGADLAATTNTIDYRLALVNQALPSKSCFVTDMMIYPPIEHDAHFCGTGCLRRWLDKHYPSNKLDNDNG